MMSIINNLAVLAIVAMPMLFALGNGIIDIVLSSIVIIYILRLIKDKDFSALKCSWFIAFTILWMYLTIRGLLLAEDVWTSLRTALPMLRFPLFALAIAYFINHNPEIKSKLFFASAIALIFLSINAVVQMAIGVDVFGNNIIQHENFFRLTTPTGKQRIGYACTFIILPLLGYFLDMILKTKLSRISFYVMGIAIIMGLATIVFSGERMPLAITLFSVFIGFLGVDKFRKKALAAFALAAIVVTVIIASAPQLHYRLINTTSNQLINFQKDAYGKIYKTAWLMFLDNKLFGIGTNQFANQCSEFTLHMDENLVMCATHPHNFYLQMLSEDGILGLALFVLAVGLLFIKLYRCSYENYAKFAGILALTKFIPVVPAASFYIAWSSGPIWFAIGLALSSTVANSKSHK